MSAFQTITPAGYRLATAVRTVMEQTDATNLAHARMRVHRLAAIALADDLAAAGNALHAAAADRSLDVDGFKIAIGEAALAVVHAA